ncbi:Dihydrodipicolinate reductase [Methanococcus vannielii SB]|jgi:4-hydroxy-tetrahydrodipicolinate reductase|uniref:4-hydroxy-tetrahydrodipicolinate reductase n=1 Tax=Methanococcus vannielii (strain ATCC 35089 / DSM 1224 / JCM 13029 / OCM 148 / SB) TaxID=406327 RepID=DAPB_METVS|nr:4-hydroxy-tetrahydrodipicolinate reductase [Methanococcus vannielii]A6UNQ4.1 RecName: Full=4-hydroxy-tetrahydrodipicolinate reductase; Short=HTPA reductase [Methanococcus vannielii SB]ABR54126.1 Dihydrodipicolinate reductase [Methanococcus vannielii SB]
MVKVAVTGALGRMGSGIIQKILETEGLNVVAAIDIPNHPKKGHDIGELIGIGKLGVNLSTSDELESVLKSSGAEVLVDFTAPAPCVNTAKIASKCGVNLVIGTTGFTKEQKDEMEKAIFENKVAATISQNYAVGVNIFFKTLELLAQKLGEYDIEIVEMHHKFKKDAPSGTALRAAEIIQENLNRNSNLIYGREGITGERTKEEICIHALRGGDVVGDHTVIFANDGERLELSHKASSRQSFIAGVILAIKFVGTKKEGIFNTFDVLGLN